MTKQKSTILFSGIVGIGLLSIVLMTGCNDEKKSSTESTVTDTSTISSPAPTFIDTTTMHGDTNRMDTATTRPIVPGT